MPTSSTAPSAGPAGHAPPSPRGEPQAYTGPVAVEFDGATRDWVVTDGDWQAIHPVDQQVAFGLMMERGKLKSAPDVGHTLREIRYLGGENLGADVRDRVRTANPIAQLIADEDIAVDRIEHSSEGGRLAVAFYYVNLRQDRTSVLRRDARI